MKYRRNPFILRCHLKRAGLLTNLVTEGPIPMKPTIWGLSSSMGVMRPCVCRNETQDVEPRLPPDQ